jgi:hypothetical protein
VPIRVRHAREQAVPRETGVVDEDVDVACPLDQGLRLLGVGDVGLDGPPAGLLRDALGFLAARAVADDDVRSGPRELESDRSADSARRAGDKRRLAFERAELRQS